MYKLTCFLRTMGFALAVLMCSHSAQAALINNTTTSDFTVLWSYAVSPTKTLKATASFDVTSFSASEIDITIHIINNTILGGLANAGLASFGFSWDPNPSSATGVAGSTFSGFSFSNIPSLSAVEYCIFAGNNCNGGPQGNLLAVGASDTVGIKIFSNTNAFANGLNLNNFGTKFQTSAGSYEFYGCVSGTQGCGNGGNTGSGGQTPEPQILALFGLGLAGLFAMRRRARMQ